MFIKFIKEISLKKILKKSLTSVKPSILNTSIKTIGVIIDESYFQETNKLVAEIVKSGINKNDISVLIFKNAIKKNEIIPFPSFSGNDVNWKGDFTTNSVNDFIAVKYDLLISYYDVEKAPLLLTTHRSKALFKVGFSTIDKRLNDLMINTNAENYQVFVHELFRYLKILNKI